MNLNHRDCSYKEEMYKHGKCIQIYKTSHSLYFYCSSRWISVAMHTSSLNRLLCEHFSLEHLFILNNIWIRLYL